jgi:DNA modification methylase
MQTIQLSRIIIKENRQRQEFEPEAMQELINSISDQGLFHPPVLRQEAGEFVLVAGERRLKAMSEIFELGGEFRHGQQVFHADEGIVPFTDMGELSPLEAEECELDENLRRRDLTWQEHAAAVARLHALRQNQQQQVFEEALQSGEVHGDASEVAEQFPKHTIADTAEELTGRRDGSYQDQVRKEILVARHLDNPLLAKAKSADEALKILKKEEARQKNVELAAVVGASFTADLHRVFNLNCLEFMRLPENQATFDIILTDPPYGMGADDFGDGGGKLTNSEHHYDDSYEAWLELMKVWCPLSFVVTKPQAHAYVFCDVDRFHELKAMMQAAGWYVFRTPLIAHKQNSGRVPLPEHGPRRQWEMILYAIKGKKPVTHIYPDVISTQADDNMTHGAQKPVALFQNLLQRSVRPGDKVVDFFAGSGTLLPAGHSLHCEVTLCEQTAEYYAMCLTRAKAVREADQLGLDLGV